MGFKHTMLQRLQNYDVSPGKMTPDNDETENDNMNANNNDSENNQNSVAPTATQNVTDFSINRILSDQSEKCTKNVNYENDRLNESVFSITPTAINSLASKANDILDLSTNSSDNFATFPANYHLANYHQLLHPELLMATKFYAHFFPQLFPTYSSAAAVTATQSSAASHVYQTHMPTSNSLYAKRYFVPYVLNQTSNNNAVNTFSPPSPTNALSCSTPSLHNTGHAVCSRPNCSNCMDYYKQHHPYKSRQSMPTLSSLTITEPENPHLKSSSSSELYVKGSTIALKTVTNLNLTTTKSLKFTSPNGSATSIGSSINSEEISYKCCICDKVFGCSQTLQAHEKTHKSPRYECSDCGKGFSQLRNYKYHLSVHRGTKEFAAECSECGKTFNDKGYLSSHMKIHRNKKEYECPYCPKSFNQRVAFNMHVRIHTGVKPHKCTECGKRFSRKMLLKQHMRTHSGEKPYQCSVCGKSFADRSNMTLHHRLHSGIKPFNCPICPKAFTKKHHLKTHLNYHTGCKPYVCPHPNCNQAFTQSSNMRTHAKKCQFRPLSAATAVVMAKQASSFPAIAVKHNNTINGNMSAIATSAAAAAVNLPASISNNSFSATSISHAFGNFTSPRFTSVPNRSLNNVTTQLTSSLSAGIRMLSSVVSVNNVNASMAMLQPFATSTTTTSSSASTSSPSQSLSSSVASLQPSSMLFPSGNQPLLSTLRHL